MQILLAETVRECTGRGLGIQRRFTLKPYLLALATALVVIGLSAAAVAQSAPLVIERDGRVISLEPYAANILRVTISSDKAAATSARDTDLLRNPLPKDGRANPTRMAARYSAPPAWLCTLLQETSRPVISQSQCLLTR